MKSNMRTLTVAALGASFLLGACSQKSSKTGWNYNDPKNGGFEVS